MQRLSVLFGFIPWIIFFLLFGESVISKEVAVIAALISHVIVNRQTIRRMFVLDIGALFFFLLFAANIFIFKYPIITNNGYFISNSVLAIIAWISLLLKKPFTLQYASLTVTREIQISRLFILINYILTFIWAILLTLMVVPNILEYYISIKYAADINMSISVLLVAIGVFITNGFPDWFMNKMIGKCFNIDIKKLYYQNSTNPLDFTNFNGDKISQIPDLITDVIIVGSGPIGLTAALLLEQFGIKSILVEKHSSVSVHPKARAVSCRSMELLRKLGLEKRIEQYELPKTQNWLGWFATLTGRIYAKVVKRIDYATISPTDEASIAQPYLEKVMLDAFCERGGEALFDHRVTDFAQNDTKVQVFVESNNNKKIFEGKYLLAADGAHSTIRQLLKISMIGPESINTVMSIYCEINLNDILEKDRNINIAFMLDQNSGATPMVLSIDGKNKWMFIFPSAGVATAALKELYSDEYSKSKIHALIGHNVDLPINIISKNVWVLGSQVANQISAGRTFLLGDSAHRFSPTGGMGMNTGLQDVDNLVWKLAYIILGKTDVGILATYQEERIPAILDNMEWSLTNLKRIVRFRKELEEKGIENIDFGAYAKEQEAHLNKSGLDLGVIYRSNIIASTNDIKPVIPTDQYIPNSYPGSRLPHFGVLQDGEMISSLDLISTEFILLFLTPANDYVSAIDFKSIPTKKICLNGASNIHEVKDGEFLSLLKLDEFGCVWVRPDGHIAWKGCLNQKPDLEKLQLLISKLKLF